MYIDYVMLVYAWDRFLCDYRCLYRAANGDINLGPEPDHPDDGYPGQAWGCHWQHSVFIIALSPGTLEPSDRLISNRVTGAAMP